MEQRTMRNLEARLAKEFSFTLSNLVPVYNLVRLHREEPLRRENFENDYEFRWMYKARIRKAIALGAFNMALIYPILEKISDKIF